MHKNLQQFNLTKRKLNQIGETAKFKTKTRRLCIELFV